MAVFFNTAFSFSADARSGGTTRKDLLIKFSSSNSFLSLFRRRFTEEKPSRFYCFSASDADKFSGETESKTNQASYLTPCEKSGLVERHRTARVLNRYTEPKPSLLKAGNKLPELLQESDKTKQQAPPDLLDDSNRGLSKQGWTTDIFPGGMDVAVIIFSFVFISFVMLASTYLVLKSSGLQTSTDCLWGFQVEKIKAYERSIH